LDSKTLPIIFKNDSSAGCNFAIGRIAKMKLIKLNLLVSSILLTSLQSFAIERDYVVPKVIYYHGQREHLLEDIRLNTIPEKVWSYSIMGPGSPWPLSRKGLYGSERPQIAEAFTKFPLQRPWFMAVTLKDDCRTRDVVAASYSMVEQNPRGNYRIVVDTAGPKSWYIRDRQCVEKLNGTPGEMLEMMTRIPYFWNEEGRRDTFFRQYSEGQNIFFTLLLALQDATGVSSQKLEKLRQVIINSNLKYRASDPYWLKNQSALLLYDFVQCRQKNKLTYLQNGLREISDKFFAAPGSHQNFDAAISAVMTFANRECSY
jgi:hypothetical protein